MYILGEMSSFRESLNFWFKRFSYYHYWKKTTTEISQTCYGSLDSEQKVNVLSIWMNDCQKKKIIQNWWWSS